MRRYNLGLFIPTTVRLMDDNTVHISNSLAGEWTTPLNEINRLYVKKPSFGENGYIYISIDGQIPDTPIGNKQTIEYTKKDIDEADHLAQALALDNDEVETIVVTRNSKMHKDPAVMSNRAPLRCPSCKSVNVQFMGNQRKAFSVGKAVAGGLLTGGVGAVAGFAGKKGQDRWHCTQCGHVFDTSPK